MFDCHDRMVHLHAYIVHKYILGTTVSRSVPQSLRIEAVDLLSTDIGKLSLPKQDFPPNQCPI